LPANKESRRNSLLRRSVGSLPVLQRVKQATGVKRKRDEDDHETDREQQLRLMQFHDRSEARNSEMQEERHRGGHIHPALREASQIRLHLPVSPDFTVNFASCNGSSIRRDHAQQATGPEAEKAKDCECYVFGCHVKSNSRCPDAGRRGALAQSSP
jgi:hypothetical protein